MDNNGKTATKNNEEPADAERVFLPPDHPLMQKFQRALKEHLLKINNQLTNEISDLDKNIVNLCKERDEIGALLYDQQQEIEHQNEILKDFTGQIVKVTEKRITNEKEVSWMKNEYDILNTKFKEDKRKHNERIVKLANAQALVNNVKLWTSEIEEEVNLAKKVVSKDNQDQKEVVRKKQQMDLILFNLDNEVRMRESELKSLTEQQQDKEECVKILEQKLSDTTADLDAVQQEYNNIIDTWNDVIKSVQQKDKALIQMQETLKKEQEEHTLLMSNMEGVKKSTRQEMEENEKLEKSKTKLEFEIETLEKHFENQLEERNQLDQKIDKLNEILNRVECDLQEDKTRQMILDSQLKIIYRCYEKTTVEKNQIEEQILELFQDQISTDQASQSRSKKLRELMDQGRNTENTMLNTEQQLSDILYRIEKWKTKVYHFKEIIEKLNKEKSNQNVKLNAKTKQIDAINTAIIIKGKTVDSLVKQLAALIETAGGQEIDPNELKIRSFEKNISEIETEIRELQQFWMKLQNHVVSLSEKRSQQLNSIQLARTQLLVIEQKTLKIDAELDALLQQDKVAQKDLKSTFIQCEQFNEKLFEKRKMSDTSKEGQAFKRQDTHEVLCVAEMTILQLESELNDRQKDIEEYKILVQKKHQQALSWETKWKMAVETRKYREDQQSSESKIGELKAEIHRLEVRYLDIKRKQDKLAQDLEYTVIHRDHIFDGQVMRGKIPYAKAKTKSTQGLRMNDIKNKIRHAENERTIIEKDISENKIRQILFTEEIDRLTNSIDKEKSEEMKQQQEIEVSTLFRQKSFEQIVRMQNRTKRYRSLFNGKNLVKCRSKDLLPNIKQQQNQIKGYMVEALHQLLDEFPAHSISIRKIQQTLTENE